ncbi:hypothetical protein H0H93_002820 [Arthromyces matolae]|nr:hypothetical protein H0H93_002820 [Arthromyces matolae]
MLVDSFTNSSSKGVLYAHIRKEIAALQEQIRAWHSRHNELSVTARLPDELLVEVFLCIPIVDRENTEKDFRPNAELSSFRVAAVCQVWRRVALDCPSLWNRFDDANAEWLNQVVLRRSTRSLLAIHTDLTHPQQDKWKGVQTVFCDHAHRVRELGLRFLVHQESKLADAVDLLSGLAKPMPCLETLLVSNESYDPLDIDVHVLERNAPNLKALTLVNCVVQMAVDVPLVLPIEHLTLEKRMAASHILAVLGACEKLQELTINSVREDMAPTTRPVVLRHLKQLTFIENSSLCVKMLSSLSCPALTHVKTSGRLSPTDLGQCLPRYIPLVKFFHIRVVYTSCEEEDLKEVSLTVRGIRDLKDVNRQFTSDNDFPMSIQSVFESPGDYILPTLLRSFNLWSLEVLQMSTTIPSKYLCKYFGDLPLLHTITFVDSDWQPLYDVTNAIRGQLWQSEEWYKEVRDARLTAQTVDVDAQNEQLSKIEAIFLSEISTPLPFQKLKRLNIVSLPRSLMLRLASALLLRHSLGIPVEEVHVDQVEEDCDVRDIIMIRQSVKSLYVGSMSAQ